MSEPKNDATQVELTEEKIQNPGAPTTEQMLPHGSSVNIARKAKKKADGPLQILAGWLLDNQTGMSRNSAYTGSVLTSPSCLPCTSWAATPTFADNDVY
jgi:hypothetical protein